MKRSLFVLVILVLSFGLSYGTMDFRLEFTGTPGDGSIPGSFLPGSPMTCAIYMDNNMDAYQGFSIYIGFTGDIDVTWATSQAFGPNGELYIDANAVPGGAWFDLGPLNFLNFYNWDGDFASVDGDEFNWTAGGMAGMPGIMGETKMAEFFFTPDAAAVMVAHYICVDSINLSIPSYDWIMATGGVWHGTGVDAGQPWCADLIMPANQPPVFTDCPTTTHNMQWHDIYNLTLNTSDPEGEPNTDAQIVTDPSTFASVTGFTANTVSVSFDPGFCAVGSYSFVVGVTDAAHTIPTGEECTVDVDVFNTAPTFDVCPTNVPIIGITEIKDIFDLDASDINTGDVLQFTLTATTAAGGVTVGLNDGIVTVDGSLAGGAGLYTADVTVTDCYGDVDVCVVNFKVVSELMYKIKINKEHAVYQGHHRMVSVIKEEGSNKMYGFDFLIAYDASALSFSKAIQGAGIADWELFTYRFGPNGNCGNACPSGMLEVVAIYDQNDGPNHPASWGTVDEGVVLDGSTLFTLDFYVSNNRLYECQFVPIKFFWTQCSDNTIAYHPAAIADPLHIETAVSYEVWIYQGPGYYEITDMHFDWGPNPEDWGFPTYTGIQDGCDHEPDPTKNPIPFIIFYGGGVDIICADDIDARGDVNLNGIENEIADAVVFTNYFIYGLAAFTVNIEGQTAATDINADGIVLSVADLVYLIRVIVGDALPYDKLSPYAASADFATANGMIATDVELGAGLFVFEGNVEVSLADGASNMEIRTAFDGTNTRALVYSLDAGATFSGNLLHANGNLVSVEASDYFGNAYKVDMLPTTFGLSNYPNPFNPSTTIMMDLPNATDWTLDVFNTLGQKVYTTSGYGAGRIPVVWDATDQASGIYFYKVSTSVDKMTKKMVLMK